jgi:superfamily II DNA or RNA helicase
MSSLPQAFQVLRRDGRALRNGDNIPFFFQFRWIDGICFVGTVDGRGVDLNVDCRTSSSDVRAALRHYTELIDERLVQWGWDSPTESSPGVSLKQHPELIADLLTCSNLVDEKMNPLTADTEIVPLTLFARISEDGKRIETALEMRSAHGGVVRIPNPLMVTDGCLLDGSSLRVFPPTGLRYDILPKFLAAVPRAQAHPFFSLFLSTFRGIPLDFAGYQSTDADRISARPALIFREVDEQGALIFDLTEVVGDLPGDFLRDYEISYFASLDDSARCVRIREIDYSLTFGVREELIRLLQKLCRQIKKPGVYFNEEEDGAFLLGPGLAREFLVDHLGLLTERFVLLGAEKLRSYRITYRQPRLRLNLGHGIDFLEGTGDLDFEGERIPILDALQQYRKNKLITLADGNQAVMDPGYMARLERLFKKAGKGVKISFFDLPLIEDLLEENEAAAALPASREVFRGFNDLANRKVTLKNFGGTLRPYQTAGVQWLDYLHEHSLGGCLADDMGLGKTVQAIALLSRLYPATREPTLVVMPRSLLFNWSSELTTFAPKLRFYTYHAGTRDWSAATESQIILTTYGTLRADIEAISQTTFHAVFLDESQAIKNSQTQTARAANLLKASFRVALSGTPVENNLGELHALFRFLNPSMFTGRAEFERDYVQPIQQESDAGAAQELRRKIYPFILRRLKTDVLKELPPKVEQVLYVEMGPEQKAYYHQRRLFYQEFVNSEVRRQGLAGSQLLVLEALLELRQIATVPESKTEGAIVSAKRERLVEALEEVLANGRKCLVFSNFLAGVEQVCEVLQEQNIPHLRMTGATVNRQELVETFQNDPRVKVFVMSLKSGGVGLNLTAADTVFLLDPWWNTAAEAQAVDRTHRIGQTNSVLTYRLIARGTIEEKILDLQKRKSQLVDQIISSDGTALKSLSEADINHLFHE